MIAQPDLRTFLDGRVALHQGDCLNVLMTLPDNSVDAVVTDPPYLLGFMGKAWDKPGPDQRAFLAEFWREVLRVLIPGGHLVAFSANRTVHRMACAIEDAGFEIRDTIWRIVAADTQVSAFLASLDDAQRAAFAEVCENSGFGGMLGWCFGSGFPKSMNVGLAIDKSLGVERNVIGTEKLSNDIRGGALLDAAHGGERSALIRDVTVATSAEAIAWDGWGTALKPALEPITLARKPLAAATVAENVLAHACGALNIEACRVPMSDADRETINAATFVAPPPPSTRGAFADDGTARAMSAHIAGRFPANVITDGSSEVVEAFPAPHGAGKARDSHEGGHGGRSGMFGLGAPAMRFGDDGSAARFFYSAKADALDRLNSKHPTIKPLDLMQWLVRLVCRKGGIVLDPFAGTGTTGEAAFREGMRAILIEREAAHCADIARRMDLATAPLARRSATVKTAKAAERAEADLLAGKSPTLTMPLFDLLAAEADAPAVVAAE